MRRLVISAKKKRPGWLKALIALAVLGTSAVAAVYLVDLVFEARWNAYESGLRAMGEPLTFEEIDALRTRASVDHSAARIIERLAGDCDWDTLKSSGLGEVYLAFERDGHDVDFSAPIPRWRVEFWRHLRKRHLGPDQACVSRTLLKKRLEMPCIMR